MVSHSRVTQFTEKLCLSIALAVLPKAIPNESKKTRFVLLFSFLLANILDSKSRVSQPQPSLFIVDQFI